MGGFQSTRKLTIDNDDPANVIKVSDAVVDRLRGSQEDNKPLKQDPASSLSHPLPAGGFPLHYSPYMYDTVPTTVQFRQEKEAMLQKNDAYWQNRINKLEETHDQINKLMDKEYSDAMNEFKGNFQEKFRAPRSPLCVEGRKAVIDCYKTNLKEPMKCAKIVQEFADCVDQQRSFIMSSTRG